jgi:phospholipid/cholesterol/gamma-HCH transport system substrate-binding protein
MNDATARFRVGLFVLVMLALLAGLVVLFGGYPNVLKPHHAYSVVLSDAAGVAAGTPVRRSGVRIGEVRDLQLDDATGQVRAHIWVDRGHSLQRTDQVALVRSLLGGDTTLDFQAEAREQPAEPAEPGTVFVVQQPAPGKGVPGLGQVEIISGMSATMKEFNKTLEQFNRLLPQVEGTVKEYQNLAKDARALLPEAKRTNDEFQTAARNWSKAGQDISAAVTAQQERLGKAVDNLNDVMVRVGRLLSDENQNNLTESLKNFRAGTGQLESTMKNVDELAKESRGVLQRVDQSVCVLTVVVANLQQASQPWAERSASIVRNLDEGAANLNRMLGEWRQALRFLGEGEGSLKLLLNDASLYANLSDAACMLVRLMPRMDRALRDMEIFADKVARHPELLGANGLFHPSTGLKK